ncbi:putative PI phosphatase group protein-like protein [Hyaloscypha variabilis]
MEEPPEESLDGSSIKPVSSLRSHFEQMAASKPPALGLRALSPQPTGGSASGSSRDPTRPGSARLEGVAFGEGPRIGRSRENEGTDSGLRPPRRDPSNISPSPTRNLRPRPVSTISAPAPPAVTIEPPQSPPKSRTLNLTLSSTPSYLSTDVPSSAVSGGSSPRHFRIPSRPGTPLLEPGRSPKLSASKPPSPPPPRRSGEFRRDASFKAPPPVNRAEKPKIASKPMALTFRSETTTLEPGPPRSTDRSSPFSTPPSSGSGSSPEHELPAPAMPRRPTPANENNVMTVTTFEPPPVHHSVASRRRNQETNGIGRAGVYEEEKRPALPSRPQPAQELSKPRSVQTSMMPPPPRPSMDRTRPVVTTVESVGPTFAAPPKRVFSTPTNQLQPPARSHGRSMTVDRTSDRTPVEFRAPITSIMPRLDGSSQFDPPPTTAARTAQPTIQPVLGDYPDPSHSNRRPPHFKQGAHEIPTKYDTRILDVCGEFVVTSGHVTKVFSVLTGETLMSLHHQEPTRILSIIFKPASNVEGEGLRLWLGSNIGELAEVDVNTGDVLATNNNAHVRREIVKIHRHLNEIWTIDDTGGFTLWGPDETGAPTLMKYAPSPRLYKSHTFSMVVGDELWHTTGKDIRVYHPTIDGSVNFNKKAEPMSQAGAGDITSGTTTTSQPDRVYFGHMDGKITIYSRKDYACVGVVNASMYRISSLAGVGENIWAGFSTGMVYVYDISQTPWVVKKDWHAHKDPVIKLHADPSSCWSLDRTQVISLGQDNMLRVWDGLLQDDWIETQMQAREGDFCDLSNIRALVMTWNAGATTPWHLQQKDQDHLFFPNLLKASESPDILVFGFQELVDLEDKKTTAKSFFKSKKKDPSEQEHMSHQYRDWRDFLTRSLDDWMPKDELYHLLHTASLVGLFTCIFVKASLRDRIRNISAAEVKRGMNGLHGNKGALIIRFVLDDTSMCFINCHLAAGQNHTKDRNTDISTILESSILPAERDHSVRQDSYVGGGDGTMILDHEICILNGDLNYRIDAMGRDTVITAIKNKNLAKLLERDQLLVSKRRNPWFRLRAFHELPITFAPTYKYDVGTDNYDTSEKKRAPAWCDRIMHRGRDRIEQLDYQRHEVRVSDHRPVTGSFQIVIKTISPKRRAMKWDECQRRLAERKEKLSHEAKLEYLTHIVGYNTEDSKTLVLRKEGR